VNRKPVDKKRVEKTQPNMFLAGRTADLGIDNQRPMVQKNGIGAATRVTPRIKKITLELGVAK
jgi:hypothetical protein